MLKCCNQNQICINVVVKITHVKLQPSLMNLRLIFCEWVVSVAGDCCERKYSSVHRSWTLHMQQIFPICPSSKRDPRFPPFLSEQTEAAEAGVWLDLICKHGVFYIVLIMHCMCLFSGFSGKMFPGLSKKSLLNRLLLYLQCTDDVTFHRYPYYNQSFNI